MTKFGLKLESAKSKRFAGYYADYDKLKDVLTQCQKALGRSSSSDGYPCGARNFEPSRGLVEVRHTLSGGDPDETCLSAGTTPAERDTLMTMRRCSSPAAMVASRSVGSLRRLNSLTNLRGADEDSAKHWTRLLLSGSPSLVFLIHGFDVALVAECEKAEKRYDDELQLLQLRWNQHQAEHLPKKRRKEKRSFLNRLSQLRSETTLTEHVRRALFGANGKTANYEAIAKGDDDEENGQSSGSSPRRPTHVRVDSDDDDDDVEDATAMMARSAGVDVGEAVSLKRALAQLVKDCGELIEFAHWNYNAFVKISKKRDKVLSKERAYRELFCEKVRRTSPVWEASETWALQNEVREAFAELFCDGEAPEADMQLREMEKKDSVEYDADAVRFGTLKGVAFMLLVWVLWDCIEVTGSVATKPAWPIFRMCGELLAWHWMYGFLLSNWHFYRVNVDFLFDVVYDPALGDASYVTQFEVYHEAAFETIFLLAALLVYYKATYVGGLPTLLARFVAPDHVAAGVPVLVVLATALRLVWPWQRRRNLWHSISKILAAPCAEVRFVDTYVADVLSSMVKVFLDALWAFCFFASGEFSLQHERKALSAAVVGSVNNQEQDSADDAQEESVAFAVPNCVTRTFYKNVAAPAICLLPLWFRFAQCLRKYHDVRKRLHLLNAVKYALSLFVALSSALDLASHQRLWLGLFALSSFYSWLWDVFVDWGVSLPCFPDLLDKAKLPRLLPPNVLFVSFDLLGRFVWLTTLIPPVGFFAQRLENIVPDYFVPMLALVELGRRCMWSFFRLENEHVSNAFGHRAEHQFVPSHFTRAHMASDRPPSNGGGRFLQGKLETIGMAALVVYVLVRISLSAKGADFGGVVAPSVTPAPVSESRFDDDFFGGGT